MKYKRKGLTEREIEACTQAAILIAECSEFYICNAIDPDDHHSPFQRQLIKKIKRFVCGPRREDWSDASLILGHPSMAPWAMARRNRIGALAAFVEFELGV